MRKTITTTLLAFLLLATAAPTLLANSANAEPSNSTNVQRSDDGQWWKIQTDSITLLFPADGKKPMFLWYYSNDTSKIYVVKYKGLIEYMTLDYQYYMQKYEANPLTVQERLEAKFASQGPHQVRIKERIIEAYVGWLLNFHPSYLPFSACNWTLTGPVEVNRENGASYVSFNFTLTQAPQKFNFAEDNVIIRCRFYTTAATEDAYGLYNYTVNPGELKMDIVIKNWEWNIDKLNSLFNFLHDEYNITVPQMRAGLALWTDMASITIQDMPIADEDANFTMAVIPDNSTLAPSEPVETNSNTADIIAGEQRIQVQNKMGNDTTPLNLGNRLQERFRLQFAEGSKTLAGFFDFVNTAVVINPETEDTSMVNVTAAYMSAGNHLRLFICYPYFGSNTLEHDPSIGVESVAPWLPINLLLILIGSTVIIAIAVATIKLRKKTVNIVNVH